MSTFTCPITKILKVEPIEGKDRIELYYVLGYQVIDQKGNYKVGDLVTFMPPDSILKMDRPEFGFLKARAKDKAEYRLRTMKMGGVLSQGLLQPCPAGMKEGDDASKFYDIAKYEPLEELDKRESYGKLQRFLLKRVSWARKKYHFPEHIPQTDSERWQNYPDVFDQFPGEYVATEKLEGCSSTFYLKDGVYGVCSRSVLKYRSGEGKLWNRAVLWLLRKLGVGKNFDGKNHWVEVSKRWDVEKRLRKFFESNSFGFDSGDIAVQAEVIGPSVGAAVRNVYKLVQNDFRVFDIMIAGVYVNHDMATKIAEELGLPFVPVVYKGELPAKDKMVEFSNGPSALLASELREGLVWKPTVERKHPKLGRVQLKVISPEYQLKHGL